MKAKNFLTVALSAVLAASCFNLPATAQQRDEEKPAAISTDGAAGVSWQLKTPSASATLTISSPGGFVFRKEFPGGVAPFFNAAGLGAANLPDGQYIYELRLTQTNGRQNAPLRTRRVGDEDAGGGQGSDGGSANAEVKELVQSGSFRVENNRIFVGAAGEGVEASVVKSRQIKKQPDTTAKIVQPNDVVTADDQIVQGSLCVGFDCVNNESFGFDTIRMKENNTRLTFTDTSASTSFATRDWRLRANDSASGGANGFFIDDLGDDGGTTGSETSVATPFGILAGAPTNSFFVDSTGKIGLRTNTPLLDLHFVTGDTPAVRLQQTTANGFTAQTWDIGANEANFFVRDLTGGSRLPFRIRPGAPTSSVDIGADGVVSFGRGIKLPPLDNNGVPTGPPVDQTALLSPLGPNFATHLTGAIGVVDEGSTTFVDMDNINGVGIKPGTSAQAFVRYNIPPNPNLFAAGSAQMVYKIRYRDSDGAGNGARVIVVMHQTDVTTGVDTETELFRSNTKPATGANFATETICVPTNGTPLSFANQSLWIEVRIGATNTGVQANFSQMQIYRGLSCP